MTKIDNQMFYNEQAIKIANPMARQFFINLRDEEMQHINMLQKEINSIEGKPFPVSKIIPKIQL
jgi:rubrerythrin